MRSKVATNESKHCPRARTDWKFPEHGRRAALADHLVASGIDAHLAAWFVALIPMVCCRVLLKDTGVKFSNMFKRRLADGAISEEKSLTSAPLWDELYTFMDTGSKRRSLARGVARLSRS